MSMWEDVCAFHQKFELPRNEVPGLLNEELKDFRIRFLQEELDEFVEACENNDDAKAFDALIDLVYVALGTAYMMNLPWDDGWYQVQFANMKKVRVKNEDESKRGSIYDIIKPEGWVSPDMRLKAILLMEQHQAKMKKFMKTVEDDEKIVK